MNDTYIATFKSIDKSKLMKKEEVLRFLEDNGANEPTLAMLSEQYHKTVGIDPIWRYPLSDDMHNGGFIVPVQEGYLWLPYDEVDKEYYEIIIPEEARMMDAECCERLHQDLREHTDSLCAVLKAIVEVSCGTTPQEIGTVQYYSVWDGGIEIGSQAKVNIRTGEVFDFGESSMEVDGIDNLDREYIVLNGIEVEVYQDVNGFDYWADFDNICKQVDDDLAILDAMTEHNFHALRGTCDKYMIRGKLLCLLSDHCGVPARL